MSDYNVEFNIRGGGVQTVGDENFGTLVCDISGNPEKITAALDELRRNNIMVTEADL